MTLEKRVFHDCQPPNVAPYSEYRWTCPECGSAWSHWKCHPATRKQRYGFMKLKYRFVEVPDPSWGGWHCNDRTYEWEPIDEAK